MLLPVNESIIANKAYHVVLMFSYTRKHGANLFIMSYETHRSVSLFEADSTERFEKKFQDQFRQTRARKLIWMPNVSAEIGGGTTC